MSHRLAATLLGLAFIVIALIFVFVPVTAPDGFDCGNAFGGGRDSTGVSGSQLDQAAEQACAEPHADRWQYVLPVLAVGAVLLAYGVTETRSSETADAA